ncbi:MAG: hypothetical protein FWG04_05195 [Desulfovibrionaceae bacterium]|nr:hypothetical protein [Desulfovibrionaceae bacterium]
MADFPNPDFLFPENDPTFLQSMARPMMRNWQEATMQMPGARPTATFGIMNDTLRPTQASCRVDTEGGAPADDLKIIMTDGIHDGAELYLFAAHEGRIVTVVHNPVALNGISLDGGRSKTLSPASFLRLKREGNFWVEMVDGNAVGGSGVPLFTRIFSASDQSEEGFLRLDIDNGPLSRTAFPQAWAKLAQMATDGSPQVLTESAWQADVAARGFCDKFSTGDGAGTFRVPFVPLHHWYGTTRVGGLIKRVTIPAAVGSTVVYTELMQNDCCVVAVAVSTEINGYISITADSTGVSSSMAGATGMNVISSLYVRKGQTLKVSGFNTRATDHPAHGVLIYHASAPLEYPLLKMYGTVTDAGEVNIGELVQQTTALGGQVESNASFSTAEQWTGGYWIDGKKIYRKVVNLGSGPNVASKSVPHGISSIDHIIYLEATFRAITTIHPTPLATSATSMSDIYENGAGSLVWRSTMNTSAYDRCFAIIQYTCTNR